MTKEDFIQFTTATLEEAIRLAERETGVTLSRAIRLKQDLCARWCNGA